MEEVYVPIKDYETYAVSNKGNVKDLRTDRILESFPNKQEYLIVHIKNPKGFKTHTIHRLVAIHFIENEENKPEVDHIDRDRQNNNVENLRWSSDKEQAINKLCNNKYYKCIYREEGKTKRTPYSSWVIQVRNHKLKFKKRYKTNKFTLEDVKKIRDEMFKKYEIPILD